METGRGPYRTDLAFMALTIVGLLLLFVAIDLPGDIPDYYPGRFIYPGDDEEMPTQVIVEELLNETEYLDEDSSTEFELYLPWWNVTELVIELTWADDLTEIDGQPNDEFELVLWSNTTEIDRTSSINEELVINLLTPSIGNYTIEITALNCPAIIDNPDYDRDTGNDFRLRVTSYRLTGSEEVD
jgi:hypothetical protein